ncbi:bacitracin resistance protein [Microbacterium hatanonis]|uniref:Bacitracin resistance protein n=1 Tax=Microbacterium hatanonis TaxID=404366 RepID=A0A5C8I2U5_9MICO|nr:bacitracin resistance protein [Microbacterium hatanonis]TXK13337.1 bacitracin resistance protein [Microbacterium hatanonis]
MTAVEESPTMRRNPTWMVVAIAGAFGLLYAYIVWNAVGLLVSQATGPLGINVAGWALLLSAAVFPLLAFGVAFAVGYRRRAGQFALVLLTGLGLSAVFWFNVLAYAATKGAELLG